jgi:antitoxin component YwqK of YwqJK toxin-antitoxin module
MECLSTGLENSSEGVGRHRSRSHTFVVFSLSVAITFSLLSISSAITGVKMDLQEDDLIGPVQTVRIETSQFSDQAGHWVEGPRGPSVTTTYDVKGNRIERVTPDNKTLYTYNAQGDLRETVSYNPDGSLSGRTVYTYDDKGELMETVSHNPDGSLSAKTSCIYDSRGNLTETVYYDAFDTIVHKVVYTYNDKGNLAEEEIYGSSGIKGRAVYTYDAQGNRTEKAYSDLAHGPGLGIDRTVETYDANGNILELITYYTQKAGDPEEREIPPPSKFIYTYEWDTHGNWVKQTQTLCTSESGKPVCEPSLVTYRTITYYSEAETPRP